MKRRWAFSLAVVGVMLATVAAAFATNAAFSTHEDTSAAAAVSGIGTVPESKTGATLPQHSSASTPAGSSEHTYAVKNAGTVVVRLRDRSLTVGTIVAQPGWRFEPAKVEERLGIPVVEVSFIRARTEIVFTALLVDGAIVAREDVRDETGSGDDDDDGTVTPGSGQGNTGSSTTRGPQSNPGTTTTTDDSGGHGTGTTEGTDPIEPPEPTDPPEPTEPTEVEG